MPRLTRRNSVSSSGHRPRIVGERRAHAAAAAAAVAAVAASPRNFLCRLLGDLGDLVVVGIVQTALGRVLDEIERGVVSSALQHSPPAAASSAGAGVGAAPASPAAGVPAEALSSVAVAGSSVAQAFQAKAPMPAMNVIAKSPVVSLRTVRFLTLVAICLRQRRNRVLPKRFLSAEIRSDGPVFRSFYRDQCGSVPDRCRCGMSQDRAHIASRHNACLGKTRCRVEVITQKSERIDSVQERDCGIFPCRMG